MLHTGRHPCRSRHEGCWARVSWQAVNGGPVSECMGAKSTPPVHPRVSSRSSPSHLWLLWALLPITDGRQLAFGGRGVAEIGNGWMGRRRGAALPLPQSPHQGYDSERSNIDDGGDDGREKLDSAYRRSDGDRAESLRLSGDKTLHWTGKGGTQQSPKSTSNPDPPRPPSPPRGGSFLPSSLPHKQALGSGTSASGSSLRQQRSGSLLPGLRRGPPPLDHHHWTTTTGPPPPGPHPEPDSPNL
ncbi:hypothetical protein PCL_03927 [Purpureocillium lilacinum]|uniref:Uncharacterized protein n=1 Tax=Purpureocillium lilacinum TaxID=33203 RepID=A0A2U3EQF9_PURLI|nr:hypothetical protein PCL_03927 [Purpureocillium lilacinum]